MAISQEISDEKNGPKSYRDFLAKGHNLFSANPETIDVVDPILGAVVRELAATKDCGNTLIRGRCETGHEFGKILRCGREWCPTCGQLDSDAHVRRYARLIPKIQQMAQMGFFVVQWPKKSRKNLRSRAELSRLGTAIARFFKRWGYDRGIRAWDWFGDPRCPIHHMPGEHQRDAGEKDGVSWQAGEYRCAKGCVFTLDAVHPEDMDYNPHLNILVDGGKIEEMDLANLKKNLRRLLKEPQLIIHYQFSKPYTKPEGVASMLHWARYAVKPTFHNVGWDFEMIRTLAGFRGIWSWGKWIDEPLWRLENPEKPKKAGDIALVMEIQGGKCPECQEKMEWAGGVIWRVTALSVQYLLHQVGGGYLRLERKNSS